MTLLERADVLAELSGLMTEAASERGRIVFLSGEAGVGKSAVVRELRRVTPPAFRIAVGGCDPLSTPRPLGPLQDMADALGGPEATGLSGARDQLFQMLLTNLNRSLRPTLLLVEDVHWADDATFDMLRFLGRRIEPTRVLLVATFRDDEVGRRHPLRVVLGDLATSPAVCRLTVSPLSLQAVARLAQGSELDASQLYRQTGGNPFFVTEVLAAGSQSLPITVRDAVLARVVRLSAAGQAVLAAAAIAGAHVESDILTHVAGSAFGAVDECLHGGMLSIQKDGFAFRHELARQAVLSTIAPHHARALHAQVLKALQAFTSSEPARLAHHAEAAGDAAAVLTYATSAALQAAGLGAHREAAAQYARAVRCSSAPPTSLLEAYAVECALVDQLHQAIWARTEAVTRWRAAGDLLKVGENLSYLAGLYLNAGQNAEGEAASRAALEVLRALPPTREHARAYQMQAQLRMLNRDHAEAITWGEQALELAERLGDQAVVVGAYNTLGSTLILTDHERGRHLLEHSLQLAMQAGLDSRVSSAYSNLGSSYGELYRFSQADSYLAAGIAFCLERNLDAGRQYMQSWLALSHLYQGRWAAAADVATAVLNHPTAATISRIMALLALGRVRARRGDPEVWGVLNEALELATTTATLQRLAPVHAARAEAAWLAGDKQTTLLEAAAPLALAEQHRHPWFVAESTYWLGKAGTQAALPSWAAPPYTLQLHGDWASAAEAWRTLNCPYEAARALAESSDETALREALAVFEGLGARPMAQRVVQRLRASGVKGIPRGPRPSTTMNPAGLTPREFEVLDLLTAGHPDKRIASQLGLSGKTIGHHVSAILTKLGQKNRRDAVTEAVKLGLVTPK